MSGGSSPHNATGYLGNLTKEQDAKLRELWILVFIAAASVLSAAYEIDLPGGSPEKLFEALDGIKEPTVDGIVAVLKGDTRPDTAATDTTTTTNDDSAIEFRNAEEKHQEALERIDALMNHKTPKKFKAELKNRRLARAQYSRLFMHLRKMGVRDSEMRSIERILARMSPEELCIAVLLMIKQEHPDVTLLRFLRARKWEVGRAFTMICTNILWRKRLQVDDDILPKGEMYAFQQSKNEKLSPKRRKQNREFMEQLKMGKSFLHGFDRQGRPVNYVRVRIHQPGAQSEAALERYIVHVIETTRFLNVPPVESGTVVFDMTGFSLANMEYQTVKFIIRCFEANYPEHLDLLLIHNAPWIFSSIWKLIHGWLSPILASKVHFTSSVSDLSKFIDRSQIPRELNGDEDWEYKYIEPAAVENAIMEDTATRDSLMYERIMIGLKMLAATAAWISATTFAQGRPDNATVDELKHRRNATIEDFRQNYWKLDPFIRARAQVDRNGALRSDGTVVVGRGYLAGDRDEGEDEYEYEDEHQHEHEDDVESFAQNGALLDHGMSFGNGATGQNGNAV